MTYRPVDTSGDTVVTIPGEFRAVYNKGRITKLFFVPLASAAGYFGPAAEVWSGDSNLDVEEVEGPFWRAVQDALDSTGPAHVSIEWIE